eukprot:3118113-Pleurochrysis_carterae.AAC.1
MSPPERKIKLMNVSFMNENISDSKYASSVAGAAPEPRRCDESMRFTPLNGHGKHDGTSGRPRTFQEDADGGSAGPAERAQLPSRRVYLR